MVNVNQTKLLFHMGQITLPKILTFTGQSGAGKDTAERFMLELCRQNNVPVKSIHMGQIFQEYIKANMMYSKQIDSLYDSGDLIPEYIANAFFLNSIFSLKKEEVHPETLFLLNGWPRTETAADQLYEWSKWFKSIKSIHVVASDETCRGRLFRRTEKDKRRDLSLDGQPGIPDPNKIAKKMYWWTASQKVIIEKLVYYDMYISINSEGKKEILKNQLEKIFF